MCKVKTWLAVLGAALLVVSVCEQLWAGPPLDEHPWIELGSGGGSSGTVANPPRKLVTSFYLLRVAPTGGFYLIKVSRSTPSVKAVDSAGKLETKIRLAQ